FFSEKIIASVFEATGRLARTCEWEASGAAQRVDISGLPAGAYLLQLKSGGRAGWVVFLKGN
ncbi:MAG: hypothetical protein ACKVUS_21215, partial [Saprospiraceae bacterium]